MRPPSVALQVKDKAAQLRRGVPWSKRANHIQRNPDTIPPIPFVGNLEDDFPLGTMARCHGRWEGNGSTGCPTSDPFASVVSLVYGNPYLGEQLLTRRGRVLLGAPELRQPQF